MFAAQLLSWAMKTPIFIIILLMVATRAYAQGTHDTLDDPFLKLEDLDGAESEDWTITYEELSDLAENKIDINNASEDDLLRLPFLSGQQVMDIQEYLYRYGAIRSAAELMMIPSIDYNTRQMLVRCIYFGDNSSRKRFPSVDSIIRKGRNEIMATAHIPLYEREGDKNGYLGYQYKHWIRYQFTYGKWIKAGIMASQDAGEPFFAGKNKWGYDYVSPYFLMRDCGRLKALALGRYRLRFGMGIVMNSSFSLGKQASISSLGRSSQGIFAHSSRQEYNYMQGVAATVEAIRHLDLTGFVSYRKIDATLNNDDNSISTILKTGYHRTISEMSRRRNASQTIAGGNVRYHNNGFHLGATGYYTTFNKMLRPDTSRLYKRYSPQGRQFWNIGIDYGYTSRRLTIRGETATGDCGAIATINSASLMLGNRLSVMAIQRFYSYKYYSLMSSSFCEGSSVQNESGICVGMNWAVLRRLSLSSYVDYAYFPWPRYLITGTSRTFDMQHTATWTKGSWDITARYRLKTWNRDNSETHSLDRVTQHRARLAITNSNKLWLSRTQCDVSLYKQNGTSKGYMISQQAGIRTKTLQLYASVAYFNTDDYNSRVYAYERSTLYTLSFPMLHGNGLRAMASIRADIGKNLMIIAKAGTTHYFDRDVVGSGLQAINSNTITDIDIQLRWRL